MNKEKIIERIRKLLAMASDTSSPNEAVIAAKRARALMDKHQVEESDIGEIDEFGTSLSNRASYKKVPSWIQVLGAQAAKLNDCIVSFAPSPSSPGRKTIIFKGFKSDAIIAAHMHNYLVDAVNRMAKERGLSGRSQNFQYRVACVQVITERVGEIIAERTKGFKNAAGTALVPLKMAMVEDEFGKGRYKGHKCRNPTLDEIKAYRAGAVDGRKVGLNKFVEGGAEKRNIK